MKKAMDYVTRKVPCVTFSPATSSTVHYVTIQGGPKCESQLGMVGGEQQMLLNSKCFAEEQGLLILVHELLHTLGFVHEQNRPDRDDFIDLDLAHSGLKCLVGDDLRKCTVPLLKSLHRRSNIFLFTGCHNHLRIQRSLFLHIAC